MAFFSKYALAAQCGSSFAINPVSRLTSFPVRMWILIVRLDRARRTTRFQSHTEVARRILGDFSLGDDMKRRREPLKLLRGVIGMLKRTTSGVRGLGAVQF